jgi:phosphoglycerate dehydrogenase-like enzyme
MGSFEDPGTRVSKQSNPREESRRPRVLICDPIDEIGLEILAEIADVDVKGGLTTEELLAIVPNYEAIVVRSATNVTKTVIEHGLNLKVIGRAGSGLDNIDVASARQQGVQVINSPDANTLAVAEHTMALLLSLARRLPRADLSLKEGRWDKHHLTGTGLANKTLGIVGFGRIGREVANRAQAFNMKLLVNQRRPTPELIMAAEIELADLDELLSRSDFVTLHVPLSPETRNMIGADQLTRMKPTAYLINTARGGIVDEGALLKALDEGQIAGAALDVFAREPATDSTLAQHERVIATPHIGASTEDARRAAAITVAEKIVNILQAVEVETILPLRVVDLDRVVCHENIDPKRVIRLAERIDAEGILRSPPVVIEIEDKYMVLDGASRTTALKKLGFQHIIVQITSLEDGLKLHAWNHVLCEVEVGELLELLAESPHVIPKAEDADKAAEVMFAYGGLCYLQTIDGRAFVVYAAPGVNRFDALNEFTEAYISISQVERTLSDDVITLQHEHQKMAALVVYPEYSVVQVIQATQGRFFPAGITRFIIPGRVLRLNADLDVLKSDLSLGEKNRWLHELLLEKQAQGTIRYYQEPVYLLDD